MRIGIDISAFTINHTGVANYSLSLLKNILRIDKNNKYLLFAFASSNEAVRKLNETSLDMFPNVELKIYRLNSGILRRVWNFIPFIPADFLYRKIDFLHLSDMVFLPLRKIPTIATIYDMTPALFPEFHFARNISFHNKRNKFIAKKSRLVITLSENSKQDIISLLGIPSRKIRVIYGAANSSLKPISNKTYIGKVLNKYHLRESNYVLFMGSLEPRKNVEGILEAFSLIRNKIISSFQIVLIGQKAWGWTGIKKTIKRLNLDSQVVVTGYVPSEDLPVIINGARMLAYPSFYEGFGLPVLEAMSCGTPVITSNTSSLPEVVGKYGHMVDPKDYATLSQYMLKIINNQKFYNLLSKKALERSKAFSWKAAAEKTLNAYEEMGRII